MRTPKSRKPKFATYPDALAGMLSALTREEFDAALRDAQPSKRGRPPKAAAEREVALAERAQRKANAWQRPEDWPLLQPTPNLLASETAKVGRPRRVAADAPPLEQALRNFAWLLAFAMADARKGAPRQRISKDAVYEFLREPDRKREIAGRFRVKPEDLDE
jgi:hypothetical protein